MATTQKKGSGKSASGNGVKRAAASGGSGTKRTASSGGSAGKRTSSVASKSAPKSSGARGKNTQPQPRPIRREVWAVICLMLADCTLVIITVKAAILSISNFPCVFCRGVTYCTDVNFIIRFKNCRRQCLFKTASTLMCSVCFRCCYPVMRYFCITQ